MNPTVTLYRKWGTLTFCFFDHCVGLSVNQQSVNFYSYN